jgi:transcriptional regulator with XRE-family HTH domain
MGARMQFAKTAPAAKELRRQAGAWLKELRARAGLSQLQLAERLGLKYYTFVSQVENGFGRVPTESMEAWAKALGADPSDFARQLVSFYDPELHRLLFEVKP